MTLPGAVCGRHSRSGGLPHALSMDSLDYEYIASPGAATRSALSGRWFLNGQMMSVLSELVGSDGRGESEMQT